MYVHGLPPLLRLVLRFIYSTAKKIIQCHIRKESKKIPTDVLVHALQVIVVVDVLVAWDIKAALPN